MELRKDGFGSWTIVIFQSKRLCQFVPGTLSAAFGIAFLFYRPERRFSVSLWTTRGARNFRLWGPRKLSFER